jgi:Putative MetA-pathway of phenol degradation
VPLSAQTASEPEVTISTDRPAVAESSIVVPRGGFQVENGFLMTNAQGQNSLDFPESDFRYGLWQKTELRLAAPDYFSDLPSGSAASSGFGDLALGVKEQLGPFHGWDVSAIFFVSFPTGAQKISSHGYDPGLQFPWSRSVSQKSTVGGQVALYWPTVAGRHNFTGETTFFFDRQLAKSWDAFAEYAGDFPLCGGSRQLLHFGTSYRLTPRQQIDFHLAAGLSKAAPHSFVGFGYSFLFLRR